MTFEERKQLSQYILANPAKSYHTIAREFGVSATTISRVSAEFQIQRPSGKKTPAIIAATPTTPVPEPIWTALSEVL